MAKNVYMMGICGTAMGSLAGLLKQMGHEVRGSDQNIYPPMSDRLKALNIPIAEGYDPKNLDPRPDLVIVGNVMTRKHEEVQALLKSDIPYMSLPQAMGDFLIKDRHSICISGTHGKTTTTSMMAWVASYCGLNPGFLIGGVPLNFDQSFDGGTGDYFVIEGDEYDTAFFDKVPKFIHYKPRSVILTSVEFDHADIYKDLDDVKKAFTMLLKLIPEDGNLIYQAEDENIKSLLDQTTCKNCQGYGEKQGEWQIGNVSWGADYTEFDIIRNGKKVERLQSSLFGEYNLLNALSVYALATNLGLSPEKIKQAFKEFRGVKRRQEIIGKPSGITVIDDFAHHPTAVRLSIDGVKKRFSKNKVFAVFEPRSATARRKIFENDFASALSTADEVIVAPPFDQSKIPEGQRMAKEGLINKIKETNPHATLGESVDEIVHHLKQKAQSGDVILIMSNGGFGGIYKQLLNTL